MNRTGEYKTVNGYYAEVLFLDRYSFGCGYVEGDEHKVAAIWNQEGIEQTGRCGLNLDLPRTIKIPATELPKPMYINTPTRTLHVDEKIGAERMVSLHFSVEFIFI